MLSLTSQVCPNPELPGCWSLPRRKGCLSAFNGESPITCHGTPLLTTGYFAGEELNSPVSGCLVHAQGKMQLWKTTALWLAPPLPLPSSFPHPKWAYQQPANHVGVWHLMSTTPVQAYRCHRPTLWNFCNVFASGKCVLLEIWAFEIGPSLAGAWHQIFIASVYFLK